MPMNNLHRIELNAENVMQNDVGSMLSLQNKHTMTTSDLVLMEHPPNFLSIGHRPSYLCACNKHHMSHVIISCCSVLSNAPTMRGAFPLSCAIGLVP